MQKLVVVVLLVAVLVGAIVMFGSGGANADAPPALPTPNVPMPAAAAAEGPGGLVATRTQVDSSPVEGLADAPTACLQVVDHATGAPIAGASVRRLQSGHEVAFTDERGLAPVPLRGPEQLAVVVADHLLRLSAVHPGSSEEAPQTVRLVRDQWSARRRFEFGGGVADAFVRFAPRGAVEVVRPASDDPVVQRAWVEHTMLAGRPVCADVAVQLGTFDADRVHHLANGAEVRFVARGEFGIEAATTTGLVARATLRIDAADAAAVHVVFVAGSSVTGTVVDQALAPLAGAEVSVQGGEPLGLVATTGADGAFRIGPLPAGAVILHVRHGAHEPKAFGPVNAPSSAERVVLQAFAATPLRGRVRARPGLEPLAGATVVWQPGPGAAVHTTTAADGTFTLQATGQAPARLLVQAADHQPYTELVSPGAPFADYDVWPGTPQRRLAKKVSAVLAGVVLDERGMPVAGAAVQWRPARRAVPAGLPERRVLSGGALDLPLSTTTRDDGSFELETEHTGAGTLACGEVTLAAEATAGATTSGLRLQR